MGNRGEVTGPGPESEDDVRAAFGRWLSEMMHWRHLRPADLARKMGVGGSLVSRWALGRGRPDPTSCQLLADALEVPLDEVLRVAGHLPAEFRPAANEIKAQLHDLIDQLPTDVVEPYIAVFQSLLRGERRGSS